MCQQPVLYVERCAARRMHKPPQSIDGQHAMARDEDGQGVGAAGLAYRPGGGAKLPGQSAIRCRLAGRDIPERMPHPQLERGAGGRVDQIDDVGGVVPVGVEFTLQVTCADIQPGGSEGVHG